MSVASAVLGRVWGLRRHDTTIYYESVLVICKQDDRRPEVFRESFALQGVIRLAV